MGSVEQRRCSLRTVLLTIVGTIVIGDACRWYIADPDPKAENTDAAQRSAEPGATLALSLVTCGQFTDESAVQQQEQELLILRELRGRGAEPDAVNQLTTDLNTRRIQGPAVREVEPSERVYAHETKYSQ